MGAALRAVPASEVRSSAEALARDLALGAPLAMRAMKKNISLDRAALSAALSRECTGAGGKLCELGSRRRHPGEPAAARGEIRRAVTHAGHRAFRRF